MKTKLDRSHCTCGEIKIRGGVACPACDLTPGEDSADWPATFPEDWVPKAKPPPGPRWDEQAAGELLRKQLDPTRESNSTTRHYLKVLRVHKVFPPDDRGISPILYLDDEGKPWTAWINEDNQLAWVDKGW